MKKAQTARKPNYMLVFLILAVLTAVEVTVAFTSLAQSARILFLVGLALAKATLVAMYYMHLRFEGPLLRIIAVVPLFFAIILTLLPFLDLGLPR